MISKTTAYLQKCRQERVDPQPKLKSEVPCTVTVLRTLASNTPAGPHIEKGTNAPTLLGKMIHYERALEVPNLEQIIKRHLHEQLGYISEHLGKDLAEKGNRVQGIHYLNCAIEHLKESRALLTSDKQAARTLEKAKDLLVEFDRTKDKKQISLAVDLLTQALNLPLSDKRLKKESEEKLREIISVYLPLVQPKTG